MRTAAAGPDRVLIPLLLILGPVACSGTGPRTPGPAPAPLVLAAPDERITDLLLAALQADTRMQAPDTLYTSDASVISNGEVRHVPPRFAGIEPGGEAAITASLVEVRAGVAWAWMEYRWMSTREGRVREGRATVVLLPGPGGEGGWRIRHAHSSTPSGMP